MSITFLWVAKWIGIIGGGFFGFYLFIEFIEWMANVPSKEYTAEKIDPLKGDIKKIKRDIIKSENKREKMQLQINELQNEIVKIKSFIGLDQIEAIEEASQQLKESNL